MEKVRKKKESARRKGEAMERPQGNKEDRNEKDKEISDGSIERKTKLMLNKLKENLIQRYEGKRMHEN